MCFWLVEEEAMIHPNIQEPWLLETAIFYSYVISKVAVGVIIQTGAVG